MKIIYLILILLVPAAGICQEKNGTEKKELDAPAFQLQKGQENLPTYIKSDTLTLKSEERVFEYSGNVEVKQGDFTLTSDIMDGKYDDNNKIQQLVARQNVVIIKGEEIRAHGERATYDAASETVVITENPELQQNESVLTADLIRIFLKENRSTAEGSVRVKLVNDKKEEGKNSEQSTDIKSILKK